MNYGLLIIVVVLLVGSLLLAQRNRQRAAGRERVMRESIGLGTVVMTTSGLYGTVVGLNDDDTVQLSIAAGVEVKWAMAALRDAASLPDRYRGPITNGSDGADGDPGPDHPDHDPPHREN